MTDHSRPPMGEVFIGVHADLDQRNEQGWQTYGRRLTPFDGRDSLQDAYEEALDLAVYLKKALLERQAAEQPVEEAFVAACGDRGAHPWHYWMTPDQIRHRCAGHAFDHT